MQGQNNLLENDLVIDATTAAHLKELLMWAKVLAIIGFVMSGVIAVIAIVSGTVFYKLTGKYSGGALGGGTVVAIYLAIAALSFFMSSFLFRFAKKAKIALVDHDQENITAAFKNLKIYFRFAGIISIVSLIFVVLGAIGLMIASTFSRY